MDALRKSVKGDRAGAQQKPGRSQAKKGKKRIEGQREMLLPISGKKGKEAAAKATARPSGRHRKAG
jgi:DNA end-binding protein Ku